MYALRASSAGLGGPPAPAHIVSSISTGPRGINGASPFISAHPDRDIAATPAARPTRGPADRQLVAANRVGDRDRARERRGAEAVDGDSADRVGEESEHRPPAR